MDHPCELTILMPCLNEAETLARCIRKATTFLSQAGVDGEILIADHGSTDGSQAIAANLGARVLPVARRGYGNALAAGIRAARGKYVIMGDSDDSYDFGALDVFVSRLRDGFDLVMGNRFRGGIRPGAMPILHRFLGNPGITAIGRLFFRSKCGDFYCGLRGFRRESILKLDLQATGMEFAIEMVVKATNAKIKVTEVPTTLDPDGRSRPPHLKTWRDGWRTLRFLLLFSPRWLFLYPGFALFCLGLIGMAWLLPATRRVGSVSFDIHTLLYASLAVTAGFQSMQFWVFAKIYGTRVGIVPRDPWFRRVIGAATLEIGLITGMILLLIGLVLAVLAVSAWDSAGFGELPYAQTMRLAIPSATAIMLAFQTAYGAFFVSVLEIRANSADEVSVSGNSPQIETATLVRAVVE